MAETEHTHESLARTAQAAQEGRERRRHERGIGSKIVPQAELDLGRLDHEGTAALAAEILARLDALGGTRGHARPGQRARSSLLDQLQALRQRIPVELGARAGEGLS